ncbi:MAG: threonine ammonia-lyase [Acetobacter sp.]|nr:threonine ammonia-lyase [Acetobacter sp.]
MISFEDIIAAAKRIEGKVLRTPVVPSQALSKATGANVILKLENLQTVGSFKERGAANKLALLSSRERAHGVIAVSAGNHAQGVARHANLLDIDAVIVMPRFTPLGKVMSTRNFGAKVLLEGDNFAESLEFAQTLQARDGRTFIHPYDDPAIIAGQGTCALELFEDAGEIDTLIIPIGGGGFLSGCAVAARAMRPDITLIGVQVEHYDSLRQFPGPATHPSGGTTIAEGIAVFQIGQKTDAIIRKLVDQVLVVSECAIEDAITLLAEGAHQVSEGAGAASLAALLSYPELFQNKKVAFPISGGNIDSRILANTLLRAMLRDGRILHLTLEIPDRPGVLADISTMIGKAGGNILEVSHQRLFAAPSVQAAELEIMVETRDIEHADQITKVLAEKYLVRRL